MRIIVIKKIIQRNHTFAFFFLRVLVTEPLHVFRLSQIQIWRMASLFLWYLMSKVLFSSFQFKCSQYYTWVMKSIAKHQQQKKLNIHCTVQNTFSNFFMFCNIFHYNAHFFWLNLLILWTIWLRSTADKTKPASPKSKRHHLVKCAMMCNDLWVLSFNRESCSSRKQRDKVVDHFMMN